MLNRLAFLALCLSVAVLYACNNECKCGCGGTTTPPPPDPSNPKIENGTNLSPGKPEVQVISNGVTFIGFREVLSETVDHNKLYSGKGDVFLGIPYAVPLTKETSFRKSVKITHKPGETVIAKEFGPACLQNDKNKWISVYGVGISHDCLTLNIFKPVDANKNNQLPIIVFVHGGFFSQGTAAQMLPRAMIRSFVNRGFVVMSIQYRIGMWSFLTDYSDDLLSANRAITDAATALSYIHDIAADFGGDASQITLLGHSAGACLVDGLAMTPQYNGLFNRAGMSSGSRRFCQESKGRNGDARKTQNQALIETYCPHIDDSKLPNAEIGKELEKCLLGYSNEKLIEIQKLQQVGFAFVVDKRVINNPYLPSFDKDPITVNHDMLYSSSAQEYASLEDVVSNKTKTWNRDSLEARIEKLTFTGSFPPSDTDLYRKQVKAIKQNYLALSADEPAYRNQVINAFTDVGFVLPAIRSIALANSPRVYYMSNEVPFTPFRNEHSYVAATHSSDINRLFPSYMWTGNATPFTDNLAFELISVNNFAEIWSSFAKTGKPTDKAVPAVTGVMFLKDRVSPLACTVIKAETVEDVTCDHTSTLLYEELPSLFYWNQTTLGFFD